MSAAHAAAMTIPTIDAPGAATGRPRRTAWFAAAAAPAVLWLLLPRVAADAQPPLYATLTGAMLVLIAVTVAITDATERLIPNWVTYPAVLWALAINVLASTPAGEPYVAALGAVGWSSSVAGFLALFVAMLVIFSFTGGGAGDVKLCGAIGALLGVDRGVDAVLMAILAAGAAIALWLIATQGPMRLFDVLVRPLASRLLPTVFDAPTAEQRRLMTQPAPLGPFFAIGILLTLADVRPDWLAL